MLTLDRTADEIVRRALERKAANSANRSDWKDIARDEQQRPDHADAWALIGGRGSGKTRAGAEDFLERVRAGVKRLHIIAPTFADCRDVCVEGESGILSCAKPGEVVQWNRSMGEITFKGGAKAKCFAAVEPDRLNGPQCGHLWADEFGLYGDTGAIDMALFGLRLGDRVTSCWTSTPKMTKSTRYVLALANLALKRMKTRDNYANLAKGVVDQLEAKYGGTRLGRQELEGEVLEEVEGALWEQAWFKIPGFRLPAAIGEDAEGKRQFVPPPQVVRVVVALDPTVSDREKAKNPHKEPDACGIIIAGLGSDARGYVLGDFTAILPPAEWSKLAVKLFDFTKAGGIIAEANQGGELIAEVIRGISPNVPVQLVHASMQKRPRAEPVAMLYEQGRVSHCGEMRDLEDQQLTWDGSDPSVKSPNNIDALVWAFHALGLCTATGTKSTSRIQQVKR